MIPYFTLTAIPIGPFHIQVWGLFVALGILTAVMLGARIAEKRGLDRDTVFDLAFWIIVSAFVSARLFYAIAYDPGTYLAEPIRFLRIWEGGWSSFGGFIGAGIAAALFAWRKKIPFAPYADIGAFVLPLGYGIGRIGCFLIHDHPGTLSHSLLAVRFPEGPRLDHGLLLSLLGFAIFGIFLVMDRRAKTRRQGAYLPLFMVLYGTARFFLDFFRAWDLSGADARYFMLTPAQFGTLVMMAFAAIFLMKQAKTHEVLPQGK